MLNKMAPCNLILTRKTTLQGIKYFSFSPCLDESVALLLNSTIAQLSKLVINGTTVHSIMYEQRATFLRMSIEFTGRSLMINYKRFGLSSNEAERLRDYTLLDYETLMMYKSVQEYNTELFSHILISLSAKLEQIFSGLRSTLVSLAFAKRVPYPMAVTMNMSTLTERLLETSLMGVKVLRKFNEDLNTSKSVGMILEQIRNLTIFQLNYLESQPLLWSSEQLWLLSYEDLIFGLSKKHEQQILEGKVKSAVQMLRLGPYSAVIELYAIPLSVINGKNMLHIYNDTLGINSDQYYDVTKYNPSDRLLFHKSTNEDVRRILRIFPESNFYALELHNIEQSYLVLSQLGNILVSSLAEFTLGNIDSFSHYANDSIINTLVKAGVQIPIDFNTDLTEIAFQPAVVNEDQLKVYFLNILQNMSLLQLSQRLDEPYEDMMKAKLLTTVDKTVLGE